MDGVDTTWAMLHDILGFKGNSTGTYYLGVVVGVNYNTQGERVLEVRFWMPKAKILDERPVMLTSLDKVDLIGGMPSWVEWDT